jgi:tRNA-(ms[2]io[6]A)-hydroxylase
LVEILQAATPPGWAAAATRDFSAFLADHADCERKAAASCLSFVGKYHEHPFLVDPLLTLAREELEHFQQVYRVMAKRGIPMRLAEPDPYVNGLLEAVRTGPTERLVDRLLICAFVEARSCERLHLVAEELADPELKDFYATLARAEAGHHKVYLRIAERFVSESELAAAVARLGAHEAQVMLKTPWRATVH